MIILQFILGLRDSLQLASSIKRYLYPKQNLTFLQLLKKLLRQECTPEPFESQTIGEKAFESVRQAIKFTLLVIFYGLIQSGTEYLTNSIIIGAIIYWPLVIITYSSFAAGMWMRTQEMTQEAIKLEHQYYESAQFIGYQIEEASPIQAMDDMMTRIIFSILFQVQSNLVCNIVKLLPLPFSLLKIPIYALFISIQNISAKIPYKTHLAYYYNQNQYYLIGLNLLFSCYLHFSSFPLFTGILWFVMPWYLLNSIPREPPIIQNIDSNNYLQICVKAIYASNDQEIEGIKIERESYFQHLQELNQNKEYQEKCIAHKSYISLPTLLVPHVQAILSKALSLVQGHQKIE